MTPRAIPERALPIVRGVQNVAIATKPPQRSPPSVGVPSNAQHRPRARPTLTKAAALTLAMVASAALAVLILDPFGLWQPVTAKKKEEEGAA